MLFSNVFVEFVHTQVICFCLKTRRCCVWGIVFFQCTHSGWNVKHWIVDFIALGKFCLLEFKSTRIFYLWNLVLVFPGYKIRSNVQEQKGQSIKIIKSQFFSSNILSSNLKFKAKKNTIKYIFGSNNWPCNHTQRVCCKSIQFVHAAQKT